MFHLSKSTYSIGVQKGLKILYYNANIICFLAKGSQQSVYNARSWYIYTADIKHRYVQAVFYSKHKKFNEFKLRNQARHVLYTPHIGVCYKRMIRQIWISKPSYLFLMQWLFRFYSIVLKCGAFIVLLTLIKCPFLQEHFRR